MLLIGVVLAGGLSGFHPESRHLLADEETQVFIKTDARILLIKGQRVELQNLLHLCDKSGIHLPYAPGLLEVRLEFVFLSIFLAEVCDNRSQ